MNEALRLTRKKSKVSIAPIFFLSFSSISCQSSLKKKVSLKLNWGKPYFSNSGEVIEGKIAFFTGGILFLKRPSFFFFESLLNLNGMEVQSVSTAVQLTTNSDLIERK